MTMRRPIKRRANSQGSAAGSDALHTARETAGDTVLVELRDLVEDGAAVGSQRGGQGAGRAVFVEGGLPGELARAVVTQERSRFARARFVACEDPHPMRREPPCAHADDCGGCAWQHLSYAAQLSAKKDLALRGLAELLSRYDQPTLDAAAVRMESAGEWGWRARARLQWSVDSAREGGECVSIGYMARGSSRVVDIAQCPVLRPEVFAAVGWLRRALAQAAQQQTEGWARARGTAVITSDGPHTDNPGVVIDVRTRQASASVLAGALLDVARAELSLRGAGPSLRGYVVRGRASEVPWGADGATWPSVKGATVSYPIGGFTQARSDLALALVERVCGWLSGYEQVADWFCGSGTFALPLARRGASVVAADSSAEAVHHLARTAASEGLSLSASVTNLFAASGARWAAEAPVAAAVLDPPREGALELMRALAGSPVREIAYVSCHPATWRRDVERLLRADFRLVELVLYDLFPQSPHVEMASRWRRDSPAAERRR